MIAAALALYAAVSLSPYDWQVKGWVDNAAERLPGGGLRFENPGIALTKAAPAWVASAMRDDRLEISLRVRSLAPEQFGPARILTLSADPFERNLMVGQDGSDLILRLRTAWTDANGTIENQPVARMPGMFLEDDWVDLCILIEPGSLLIAVGDERLVSQALPPRPLETWNPSYRLALGNELTGDRPWLGEIGRAVVRAGDRTEDLAQASGLEFPRRFLITWQSPKLVPLRDLNLEDAVKNVVLYVPLGCLLGFLLGRSSRQGHWRGALGALLLIAAVSASMEVLQVFLPQRWPSVDDVIFNTLGGGLGLVLGLWAARRLAAEARR
jgi:hypothetical protein